MSAVFGTRQSELSALYSGHHGWLVGWLHRRLGCSHQADDLAQDTFERIAVRLGEPASGRVAGTGAPLRALSEPRAYLTTVAKRVLSNHGRRQRLEAAYLESVALLPPRLTPSPEERLVILQTLEEIDAMLEALPPKARSAFLMAQLDGLGYAEIALRLNVATRTVKRYMAQAFEQCMLIAG